MIFGRKIFGNSLFISLYHVEYPQKNWILKNYFFGHRTGHALRGIVQNAAVLNFGRKSVKSVKYNPFFLPKTFSTVKYSGIVFEMPK